MKRCFSFLAALAVVLSPTVSAQFVSDLPAHLQVPSQPFDSQTAFVDCTSETIGEAGLTNFFRNGNDGANNEAVFGQSFTAPCDGQIDEITITLYNSANSPADESAMINLVLLEGAGGSGDEIASQEFLLASPTEANGIEEPVLALDDGFNVTEGEMYTFFLVPLDDNQLQLIGANAPTYDGGDLYAADFGDLSSAETITSTTTGNNFDLTFQISFEEAVEGTASEAGPEGSVISIGSLMPNPATAAARLPFTLQSASDVRLSVYDVLGREVAVLATGAYGPGTHNAPMDASKLAAGTYVARLVSEDAVVTRTITVVR